MKPTVRCWSCRGEMKAEPLGDEATLATYRCVGCGERIYDPIMCPQCGFWVRHCTCWGLGIYLATVSAAEEMDIEEVPTRLTHEQLDEMRAASQRRLDDLYAED